MRFVRGGGRGKRHGRRRDRIIRPMMLAETEDVEADPVGELDLLQQIGEALVDVDRFAGQRIAAGFDESVSAELHRRPHGRALPGAGRAMLA